MNKNEPTQKYYLEENRRLELMFYSRQYPIWNKAYAALTKKLKTLKSDDQKADRIMAAMHKYERLIGRIERAAVCACPGDRDCIIAAVTSGKTYDELSTQFVLDLSAEDFDAAIVRYYIYLNELRD